MIEIIERVEPLLGCSLTGIIRANQGIHNAIVLVHGPMSCSSGHRSIPLQANNHPIIATTHLTEIDLVRGTEEKLVENIRVIYTLYHPSLITVALTCATSLIGEYYETRLKDLSSELGCRILCVDGSAQAGTEVDGFVSFFNEINCILTTQDKNQKELVKGVNLRGLTSTDFAIMQDYQLLIKMLRAAFGFSVLSTLFINFNFNQEIKRITSSSISLGWLWDQNDLWVPAPYGVTGTLKWLQSCSDLLKCRINPSIYTDIKNFKKNLSHLRCKNKIQSLRIAIEGLGWWTIGLAKYLNEELGCKVLISSDQSALNYQRRFGLIADTTLVDVGNYELILHLNDFKPDIVFGSSYSNNGPWYWIPFYQPVWHPVGDPPSLMGMHGAIRIAKKLNEIVELL